MRCLYREQRYECGPYLDIDVYPVYTSKYKSSGRRKKSKPTSAVQAAYNHHLAEVKLNRLVMTNFYKNSLFYNPSYDDQHLPADDDSAKRSLTNFFNRLKRYRKKHNLPDLKYIAVTEKGSRSGRYHHHLIINCGDMSLSELDKIWGNGYAYSSALKFDECGCIGLSKYFCKGKNPKADKNNGSCVGYRWSGSRNLEKPKVSKTDGKISKRKAAELSDLGNNAVGEWEKRYPDYTFSQAKPFYNEVNGGFYIAVRMRKKTKGSGKQ